MANRMKNMSSMGKPKAKFGRGEGWDGAMPISIERKMKAKATTLDRKNKRSVKIASYETDKEI